MRKKEYYAYNKGGYPGGHYKISKKEKKKDLFAYTINKKGNVKKISKSYYDSKKQTVNFTTKSFSKFAVGGRL